MAQTARADVQQRRKHPPAFRGTGHMPAQSTRSLHPTCLMSVPGFEMALGCTLDLWGGIRTGVTLFAVSWLLPAPSEVEGAAASALSPLGSVGRLPDRRIGLAYVEPRGSDHDLYPDTLQRIVQSRLEQRLTDNGWPRFAWATRVTSARGWSDDLSGPGELIARLPNAEPPLNLARA